LHARRERERTYNQARLLAGGLAATLKLPLLRGCLYRVRFTRTQIDLSAYARRANVSGAFVAGDEAWLEGRCLLLADDVMTTGATINECARVLKRAGASRVFAVTVARG